jgi:hypothetical protein
MGGGGGIWLCGEGEDNLILTSAFHVWPFSTDLSFFFLTEANFNFYIPISLHGFQSTGQCTLHPAPMSTYGRYRTAPFNTLLPLRPMSACHYKPMDTHA